jgi:glycosyl transferase family 25
MLFDKIIYINLDRRKDRDLNVITQLKKFNLLNMSERFSAIDGKKLDLDKIDKKIITKEGIEYAKKGEILYSHLTPGAVGCALSHRAIYQKIVDENINSCLILEDDITLDDKFLDKLLNIENEIKTNDNIINYDLFFLGYHPASALNSYKYYSPNIKKLFAVYGLFGYIVTNKGAKKLLDIFPLTYQIDTEISKNTDKIDCYGIIPTKKIILSDKSSITTKFGTDIQVKNDYEGVTYNADKTNTFNKLHIILILIIIMIIFI